tara:strand:+ start:55 stop:417 length:363 start_codon:yes stop_codon:yes gene_type:complete
VPSSAGGFKLDDPLTQFAMLDYPFKHFLCQYMLLLMMVFGHSCRLQDRLRQEIYDLLSHLYTPHVGVYLNASVTFSTVIFHNHLSIFNQQKNKLLEQTKKNWGCVVGSQAAPHEITHSWW